MKRSKNLIILFANDLLSGQVRADQSGYDPVSIRRRISLENPNEIDNSINRHYPQHFQKRLLQTRSWKTNSNHQYSGINSDGTTAEGYWKGRIYRGLRNAGIVLVVWFIVIGSIGAICRCYLCWESILRGNSFRYDSNINDDDDHHQEDERSDGVDMPPVSSGYTA